MKHSITFAAVVLLVATVAGAQSQDQQADGNSAVTQGQFAQMVMDIALGYEQATPDPETALEKMKSWGIVPVTWEADEILTHGKLSGVLNQVGIDYLPGAPNKPVSASFLKTFLWRNIGRLRDYMATRLGHGFSANHVLDSGVDRAVSPSDFD